jgi:hypothetical protein
MPKSADELRNKIQELIDEYTMDVGCEKEAVGMAADALGDVHSGYIMRLDELEEEDEEDED